MSHNDYAKPLNHVIGHYYPPYRDGSSRPKQFRFSADDRRAIAKIKAAMSEQDCKVWFAHTPTDTDAVRVAIRYVAERLNTTAFEQTTIEDAGGV